MLKIKILRSPVRNNSPFESFKNQVFIRIFSKNCKSSLVFRFFKTIEKDSSHLKNNSKTDWFFTKIRATKLAISFYYFWKGCLQKMQEKIAIILGITKSEGNYKTTF